MISDKYNCIFVHIPKTGGSSVRVVLQKNDSASRKRSHMKVKRYVEELGEEVYKGMYSFAFVRNPWDRMVSFYTQPRGNPELFTDDRKAAVSMPFAGWVTYMEDQIKGRKLGNRRYLYRNQFDFLVNQNGVVDVTHVGRFENLVKDWGVVCRHINLGRVKLPRIARSRGRKPYREYYNERTKGIVTGLFERDLKFFGYEF